MWFRQDLRLKDNPALNDASKSKEVIPVYIYDTSNAGNYQLGSASRWWLHKSLQSLNQSINNSLVLLSGDPKVLLKELVHTSGADKVVWNRNYEPWQISRDKLIKSNLERNGTKVRTYNGGLLWEPHKILNSSGQPYKVFTPFYRNGCLNSPAPRIPNTRAKKCTFRYLEKMDQGIDSLGLKPQINWHIKISKSWEPGEDSAIRKLKKFLRNSVSNYNSGRDVPGKEGTSKLSPHLRFGEISPNQIWYAATKKIKEKVSVPDLECFLSQIGWREFSYYLLYHFPNIPEKNFNQRFDDYRWETEGPKLKAWQRGLTGVPIVDAGMRELWETGHMHNRVRMIVGSYLVKNLNIDWREGGAWFWDCLLDADLASNSASWQWVSGSGADASPFFRIFNPVIQGEKFDKDGIYVRKYCPEINKLPNQYIHKPWEAPEPMLHEYGIELGKNYPRPLVNLKESRSEALDKYRELSSN